MPKILKSVYKPFINSFFIVENKGKNLKAFILLHASSIFPQLPGVHAKCLISSFHGLLDRFFNAHLLFYFSLCHGENVTTNSL